MGKKLCVIICALVIVLSASGCGNKQFLDTNYTFNKAIVRMPDETVLEIEISTWKDYDGEQIQIIDKDGVVYLVSSYNCVLIKEVQK